MRSNGIEKGTTKDRLFLWHLNIRFLDSLAWHATTCSRRKLSRYLYTPVFVKPDFPLNFEKNPILPLSLVQIDGLNNIIIFLTACPNSYSMNNRTKWKRNRKREKKRDSIPTKEPALRHPLHVYSNYPPRISSRYDKSACKIRRSARDRLVEYPASVSVGCVCVRACVCARIRTRPRSVVQASPLDDRSISRTLIHRWNSIGRIRVYEILINELPPLRRKNGRIKLRFVKGY